MVTCLLGLAGTGLLGYIPAAWCLPSGSFCCGDLDWVPLVESLIEEGCLQEASLPTAMVALADIGGGALAHGGGRALELGRLFTNFLQLCGADLSWLLCLLSMALLIVGCHCLLFTLGLIGGAALILGGLRAFCSVKSGAASTSTSTATSTIISLSFFWLFVVLLLSTEDSGNKAKIKTK